MGVPKAYTGFLLFLRLSALNGRAERVVVELLHDDAAWPGRGPQRPRQSCRVAIFVRTLFRGRSHLRRSNDSKVSNPLVLFAQARDDVNDRKFLGQVVGVSLEPVAVIVELKLIAEPN